jgi:peptide/nickel transport system substrate-binding protein
MRTACLVFAVAVAAAACGGGGGSGSGSSASGGTIKASPVKSGGSITVLESSGYSGAWPAGLDPATNVDGPADQDFMEAIYG